MRSFVLRIPFAAAQVLLLSSVLSVAACTSRERRGSADAGGGADSSTVIDAGHVVEGEDAGRRELDDGGGPIDPPGEVWIGNVTRGCTFDNSIGPVLPDEAGHFGASTLTPTSYPVTVTHVGYSLMDNDGCMDGLAHRVEIYKLTEARPPNMPTAAQRIETIEVPESASGAGGRAFEHALASRVTLSEGERLVVAIQMTANDALTRSICLLTCGTGGTPMQDWWSNAAAPPFAWADMFEDFGFTSQYYIYARGE